MIFKAVKNNLYPFIHSTNTSQVPLEAQSVPAAMNKGPVETWDDE